MVSYESKFCNENFTRVKDFGDEGSGWGLLGDYIFDKGYMGKPNKLCNPPFATFYKGYSFPLIKQENQADLESCFTLARETFASNFLQSAKLDYKRPENLEIKDNKIEIFHCRIRNFCYCILSLETN